MIGSARGRSLAGAALVAMACAACGFQPGSRENAPMPPDGLGPYREAATLALCQDGVALQADGPDETGFCVPDDAGAAASCAGDEECGSRERCSCGRCVVPHCTDNAACRPGETCLLGANQCGVACAVDEDCTGSDACDRGRCAQRCTSLDDCQRGESCSRLRGVCIAISCEAGCTSSERCEVQRARRALGEPAVVPHDGALLLFVGDTEAGAIFRGRGARPDTFEVEAEPIVTDARGPAPILEDGDLVLYFARADGSAIVRVARAADRPENEEVVLVPEAPWEEGGVGAPSAAWLEGRLVLAYETAAGIGVAVRDGAGGWSGRAAPAVTSAHLEDPLLWREVSDLGSPMLLADRTALGEPRLRLWVEARGAEGAATLVDQVIPPPRNLSIATLVSLDGGTTFHPAPFNPTFARVAELGRYKAESDPWVLPGPDLVQLWYVGADVQEGTPEGLGVAVSGRETLE